MRFRSTSSCWRETFEIIVCPPRALRPYGGTGGYHPVRPRLPLPRRRTRDESLQDHRHESVRRERRGSVAAEPPPRLVDERALQLMLRSEHLPPTEPLHSRRAGHADADDRHRGTCGLVDRTTQAEARRPEGQRALLDDVAVDEKYALVSLASARRSALARRAVPVACRT